MIQEQFERLKEAVKPLANGEPELKPLGNGSYLVRIPGWKLCKGWNREVTEVLFVVPVGYPAAQPDCFWVAPTGFRVEGGGTPQNSNDSNPIPGDSEARSTTWFSWHLQSWNPSRDTMKTFLDVIKARLNPPR
jgi:hypothetical protein